MNRVLYFIRHGESLANAGGISMAHESIPLSEVGQQQAHRVAQTLAVKPTQVLVSELIRTQQTARPYCDKHQINHQMNPLLNEFHVISHELIEGMTGEQRRPIAQAYWTQGDVNLRMGIQADTFTEFRERVDGFIDAMPTLAHHTIIFGHGIWFSLLMWRLMGFEAHDKQNMLAFRRFQSSLPMPNGMTYALHTMDGQHWAIRAHQGQSKPFVQ